MELQPIFNLAHLCAKKGIKHAVISPGSRNAALTVAFARQPAIECLSVPDERSAGFIALGLSLKTKSPTVLICTSGSAALNYIPAVAEAYFNEAPLLILTADRPPEWIDQKDGQTIYQEDVFGKHAKKSFSFPSLDAHDDSEWHRQRITNEAINLTTSAPIGPVHINIPFREPFYPSETLNYDDHSLKLISASESSITNFSGKIDAFKKHKKVLIVVGQNAADDRLTELLNGLSLHGQIPIVADVISNQTDVDAIIQHHDMFLKEYTSDDLVPDLLITLGLSVISKSLKLYLRENAIEAHWHLGTHSQVADTFQSLTEIIIDSDFDLLEQIQKVTTVTKGEKNYFDRWQVLNKAAAENIINHKIDAFSEFSCYRTIFDKLPKEIDLHLANSMAVRHANLLGIKPNCSIEVFCNRGTSGIDGTNSTAVGSAIAGSKTTWLITGDVAFLYDRNAFWHNHVPSKLNIIVFNNQGGGIFRMIKGPSDQPELEEFFETKQKKTAKYLALENGFQYLACENENEFNKAFELFTQPSSDPKILEVFTSSITNTSVYKDLLNAGKMI